MEPLTNGNLHRTSSHHSTTSTKSRHSDTVRIRPRKHPSNASNTTTLSPSDKSLTSFPSLSPPASPTTTRVLTTNSAVRPPEPLTPRKPSPSPPSTVESLTATTPSIRQRNALFDDVPITSRNLPGAIHHTTDEHIHHLIAKNGDVGLVRQLAEDLAQRDAQITALQRRAEERERVLRKMLLECEVSNMDVETRLRTTEAAHDPVASERAVAAKRRSGDQESLRSVSGSIDEMMIQAMNDDVHDVNGVGLSTQEQLTPAYDAVVFDVNKPLRSGHQRGRRSRGSSQGWKDYILGSNATSRHSSRASSVASESNEDPGRTPQARVVSGAASRRKGLQSDLFRPPAESGSGRSRTSSLRHDSPFSSSPDERDSDTASHKSITSVAGWALKLVAGNGPATKPDTRSRAPNKGDETSNKKTLASSIPPLTAKAALTRARTMANGDQTVRRATPYTSLGPNGTIKATAPPRLNPLSSSPQSASSLHDSNNLGPVEMDTILPLDARPPTLTPHHDATSEDCLTDRFGFIYDQRRKKRQREAADALDGRPNSRLEMLRPGRREIREEDDPSGQDAGRDVSPDSRPETRESNEREDERPKRWQDYLRTPTFPTELLSHTPSPAATSAPKVVEASLARATTIKVAESGSIPSPSHNTEPLASTAVADNATFANPGSLSSVNLPALQDHAEPVKLLLEQLTDLHDSLQQERTVKWNEFLRKVRAERRKEGEAALTDGRSKTTMPEASLADGELIGVAGLGNKGRIGRAKWKEFKNLVLGGIPVAYRAKIWAECSGASALRVPGQYDDLVRNGADDPVVAAQIAMDIHRTLTDNIFFRKGPGVQKLNEVLLAYSRRNPEVGYCQGMNLITASLLLIMPAAEDAFWVLCTIIEQILPSGYYDDSLLASRADQQVLRQYVTELLPRLSGHLDDLGVELEALTFQWFLSVFTDCLSAEALFRVWDVILCTHDGSTFLFQIALALLKLNEAQLLDCRHPAAVYSYINHSMTNHAISIDGLIRAGEALGKVVRKEGVEERRAKAVEAERALTRERSVAAEERAKKRRAAAADEVEQKPEERGEEDEEVYTTLPPEPVRGDAEDTASVQTLP
ncbi:MAG: hypothetical protein M1817_005519 [Caeruleum heppii]|nr:MAG: hypothetical protein M1817_005519 [Caeruleum heppii]